MLKHCTISRSSMHEWSSSIGHSVSIVLHHTVNLFFYSTDSSIFRLSVSSSNTLPPSAIRLHPQSAEHIHADVHRYTIHTISLYWSEAVSYTLTIDVLETLCSGTWNMPSLSHTHTNSLMHTYTLLCEPNNIRQALLSCDRAWNIETTTEHFEPSLTSVVLIQFIL